MEDFSTNQILLEKYGKEYPLGEVHIPETDPFRFIWNDASKKILMDATDEDLLNNLFNQVLQTPENSNNQSSLAK